MHPFAHAMAAHDIASAASLLDENVVFASPIAFRPYHSRAAVAQILHAVSDVFDELRYVTAIGDATSIDHALVFRARVNNRQIEGCDLLRLGDDGAITELSVMVRPLTAAIALAEAMTTRLARAAATTAD